MQSEAPGSKPSVRPRSLPPRLSLVPPPPDPRIAELEATVATLSDEIVALRMRALEESEPELVRLALEIAERIVGREIASDPAIVGAWAKEALRKLGDRHALVVAVSPDLAHAVEGAIVDGSLPRGSCEIRDGARTIELGQDARIQAMADVLEVPVPGLAGDDA